MRQIKFRGKRIDDGEWVYGYYVEDASNRSNKFLKHGIAENECYPVEIDPLTVGQYTGRTAQCTDEIYEGDICEVTRFDHNGVDTQYKCVVEYIDGSFAFVFERNEYKHVFWFNEVYDTDSDVEVIGNIHDKEGE